ncbi:branched-chain alpha-ketoacid dehydrogenase [Xylaria bambusicola]|uniref:branched-chain alpha-ketoacid dehydrogenase n=1 Tax=Xylaria bambusicola TaxID=326684 RepID=UPI0020075B9A|nr:branched-chain alpha-ketoacid dehydrogenase [Xylaria bambusicola]KAI0515406.1 branched-chain alpha-ketoacid dehydrogenase [Xylaria bambusicola]
MLPFVVQNATKTLRLSICFSSQAPSITSTTTATAGRRPRPRAIHGLRIDQSGLGRPKNQRYTHTTAKWRPVQALDEWVAKEARPISLRQLMVFGRSLTEARLISSANYVRTELPTRIAHRIRDMQRLPYVVVTNRHISDVYELYYTAFDTFRRVKEIKTLEDNDKLCSIIAGMLRAHLSVIPKLAMGILECNGLMPAADLDRFMNTILRSRISRRVIAEQHLALTETFNSDWFSPGAKLSESEFIGEVFLKCVARDVVERCGRAVQKLVRSAYGADAAIPEIRIDGDLEVSFPYILSHLEFIIGELLRNSVQAVAEHHSKKPNKNGEKPPPIEVTLCEAQQHVIIRISDRGGGISRDTLPHLWSFGKGPSTPQRLESLGQVPLMAATLQELRIDGNFSDLQNMFPDRHAPTDPSSYNSECHNGSLTTLSGRPPNLHLGISLPLSRVYAEYWAGSLELHSLEGYGVDAFLQISKLGNKNEQLATRAAMDAV